MAVFNVISSYGNESDSTVFNFPSGDWNLFVVGSSLYLNNITDTNTSPTILITSIDSYSAIKIDNYIVLYSTTAGVLTKTIIDVEFIQYTIYSTNQVDINVVGIDCVALNNYIRLIYVNSDYELHVNDFISPLEVTPTESVTILLETEDVYQYHLINETNLEDITVYYIDDENNNIIYEVVYTILANIITITPNSGNKTTVFTADLSDVSIDYDNLVVSAMSGVVKGVQIDALNKKVTFTLKYWASGIVLIQFSDMDDSFTSSLKYRSDKAAPKNTDGGTSSGSNLTGSCNPHTQPGTKICVFS